MPGAMTKAEDQPDLYAVLGVDRAAKDTEVRRSYRNLITKEHPDKGGDPGRFRQIQQAWEVLSDPQKRATYNATGKVVKTVEEDFMDSFAGGSFRDKVRVAEATTATLSEQITVIRDDKDAQSHSAGFEAWLRSRGTGGVQVYTSDDVVEQFGVVKDSYDAVPLPRIKAYTVRCGKAGHPKEVLSVEAEPIPAELEWGQVLVNVRAAPISPADLYTVATGGLYGQDHSEPPFVGGHDGVGVIVKVGPGVKSLAENEWVIPLKTGMGSWRSLAVWKESDLLRIPADLMPLEQCALLRETITAYRLLEDNASLKPGDCVILNAANSTVGQVVIQLCCLLRLRAVAVISDRPDWEKTALWLRALGAAEVLLDEGSLKAELGKLKFFARPKLALDAVGGASAARLTEALGDGGTVVVYGCLSGKSPLWSWHNFVFGNIQVRGFNVRQWMREHRKKVPALLESVARLVSAGKLSLAYTEYELGTEFSEALEHAMERGANTKVLLKVSDIGVQY